jgi:hypothetical protein
MIRPDLAACGVNTAHHVGCKDTGLTKTILVSYLHCDGVTKLAHQPQLQAENKQQAATTGLCVCPATWMAPNHSLGLAQGDVARRFLHDVIASTQTPQGTANHNAEAVIHNKERQSLSVT